MLVLILFQEVKKKLEVAASKTKSWKDRVAHHEGLIRLIEPGRKQPFILWFSIHAVIFVLNNPLWFPRSLNIIESA